MITFLRSRWPALLLMVLVAGGGAGWVVWSGKGEPAPTEVPSDAEAAQEREAFDLFMGGAEWGPPPDRAAGEGREGPREGRGESPEGREGRWANREGWRARRQAFREKLARMTPEQRREFYRRRVSITSLGDEEATLEPEEVMNALRDVRPQVRDCVREHGGFRAMREAFRAGRGDAGARRRGFTVSFDVNEDGSPSEGSLALDPPPPEPFYECFATAFGAVELPPPGAEGARIEVTMGRGRGGRGGGPQRGGDGPRRE